MNNRDMYTITCKDLTMQGVMKGCSDICEWPVSRFLFYPPASSDKSSGLQSDVLRR